MGNTTSKKELILIVDDNTENVKILGNLLRKEYRTAVAQDGEKALCFVERQIPDLILLDVMMPKIDGFEVCKILREHEETKEIPIIFITAKVEKENILKGFDLGGQDYITKPFSKDELIRRINTLLQIKRSNKALKESNISKNKFFSILAHDLRNPISGCLNLTELLETNYDKYSEIERKKYLSLIKDSAKHLNNLIENLLEWSRLQIGRMEYSPVEFDLIDLVCDNVLLLKSIAKKKGIKLISKVDENIEIFADINMLKTVIRNLISNALKFTHKDGEVIIDAKEIYDEIEITITDTGIGIDEEKQKQLFKIDFYQKQRGTANEKGTGLGLILCKEFVEKNGGNIQVESTLGKGSIFKFTVPKAKTR